MGTKYRVRVIEHQLNNGKVAKFGEIVGSKQLNGNAEELCKKGFIELIDDNEEAVNLKKLNKENLLKYAEENDFEVNPEDTKAKIIESIEAQSEE